MKLSNVLKRSTDFGTVCSRDDLLSFTIKVIIYIVPSLLIGDIIDKTVLKFENQKTFGTYKLNYILFQTLFNIITLYIFIVLFPKYMSEFQMTMPGVYFITLYFGMQTNYMSMLKQYMNSLYNL